MAKVIKKSKDTSPKTITRTIDSSGNIFYRSANGERHREDGPAIEYHSGRKEWYQNNLLHRVDGPAIIDCNGSQFWFQRGKCHREDGPAIIYSNALEDKSYYLDNYRISEHTFFEMMKNRKMTSALTSLEKFADKLGKGKNLEKAGIAIVKFLQGACDHSFKNKNKECELCDFS